MNRDFTIDMYRRLLKAVVDAEYEFLTFEMYISGTTLPPRVIIMRHDVDRKPHNALVMARLEKDQGIISSYYFRISKESFDTEIIKKISNMGHEIGYHYEDLARTRGDKQKAIITFEKNLYRFRLYYPVKTICMHGSPMSKWDNRKLWEEYDYRDFGVIGEPYYDLDFLKILYFTDTGRHWNGERMSVRDRVNSGYNMNVKTTYDLIECINNGKIPNHVMLNVHPERWDDVFIPWFYQLVMQNTKNIVKKIIVRKNGKV